MEQVSGNWPLSKVGGRDGSLIAVSRALIQFVMAGELAGSMQQAIDDWSKSVPLLRAIFGVIKQGIKPYVC